jgi:hypothetical protein
MWLQAETSKGGQRPVALTIAETFPLSNVGPGQDEYDFFGPVGLA